MPETKVRLLNTSK